MRIAMKGRIASAVFVILLAAAPARAELLHVEMKTLGMD
jgi:hypothetical protein